MMSKFGFERKGLAAILAITSVGSALGQSTSQLPDANQLKTSKGITQSMTVKNITSCLKQAVADRASGHLDSYSTAKDGSAFLCKVSPKGFEVIAFDPDKGGGIKNGKLDIVYFQNGNVSVEVDGPMQMGPSGSAPGTFQEFNSSGGKVDPAVSSTQKTVNTMAAAYVRVVPGIK